jgi:hypothetical protein
VQADQEETAVHLEQEEMAETAEKPKIPLPMQWVLAEGEDREEAEVPEAGQEADAAVFHTGYMLIITVQNLIILPGIHSSQEEMAAREEQEVRQWAITALLAPVEDQEIRIFEKRYSRLTALPQELTITIKM